MQQFELLRVWFDKCAAVNRLVACWLAAKPFNTVQHYERVTCSFFSLFLNSRIVLEFCLMMSNRTRFEIIIYVKMTEVHPQDVQVHVKAYRTELWRDLHIYNTSPDQLQQNSTDHQENLTQQMLPVRQDDVMTAERGASHRGWSDVRSQVSKDIHNYNFVSI